jgi:hypothetical protein
LNPGTIFISHPSQSPDFDVAKALAERLREAGLDVWWDRDRLAAGENFPAEILEAIIYRRYFLFLLSRSSAASRWCRRELAAADELARTIVPLKLEEIDIDHTPLQLAELHHINLQQGIAEAWPALARTIGLGLGPAYNPENNPFARDSRLVTAIVRALRYATTFTDSLNLLRLLSDLGQSCSETDRARDLFQTMMEPDNRGPRVDYGRAALYLERTWRGK